MKTSQVFGSKYYIGFVVCLTIFTDIFVYGLVLPVLPHALIDRAGVKSQDLQLWTTVFMALYAGMVFVGSVTFGSLSDRFNNLRWTFIIGQVILLASTIAFAFAHALPLLVIARLLQGFASGAVTTVGYSLLYNAVGPASIGQALGYTSLSLSLGVFFSPIVGGFLYDAAGYFMVFLPAIILVALEILLRFMVVEPPSRREMKQAQNEREPLLNEDANSTAKTSYGGASNAGAVNDHRNTSSTPGNADAGSSSTKSKSTSPMFVLLKNPRFLTSFTCLFFFNNSGGALETVLPVFAYERFHFSSTQTGLLFICTTVPMLLSPLCGLLTDRYGAKIPTLTALVLSAAANFALLVMNYNQSQPQDQQLKVLCTILTLIGFSIASAMPPVFGEVSATVEQLESDNPKVFGDQDAVTLGFSLQMASWGAGAAVGPLYGSPLKEKFGIGAMGVVFGVLSLILCIPVVLFTGMGWTKKTEAKPGSRNDQA